MRYLLFGPAFWGFFFLDLSISEIFVDQNGVVYDVHIEIERVWMMTWKRLNTYILMP